MRENMLGNLQSVTIDKLFLSLKIPVFFTMLNWRCSLQSLRYKVYLWSCVHYNYTVGQKNCTILFLQWLCQNILQCNNYWHTYALSNLEQNDIKIINLCWSILLHWFVKRSMRARVRYQRHVSWNIIVIVSNRLNAISYKIWKDMGT